MFVSVIRTTKVAALEEDGGTLTSVFAGDRWCAGGVYPQVPWVHGYRFWGTVLQHPSD